MNTYFRRNGTVCIEFLPGEATQFFGEVFEVVLLRIKARFAASGERSAAVEEMGALGRFSALYLSACGKPMDGHLRLVGKAKSA